MTDVPAVPAAKWRIRRTPDGVHWHVESPDGNPLGAWMCNSHAEALEYIATKQREAVEAQIREHPLAALVLLLLAGAAAAGVGKGEEKGA